MRSFWFLALALLGSSCTSRLARFDDDGGVAAEVLEQRGSELPEFGDADDGALDPSVREWLAEGMDEEQAVRIALVNNRAVRAAFAELGVSAAEAAQAGLIANPTLEAEATFFDAGTELELSLVQPILNAMLVPLRRDLADAQFAEARARIAGELVALVHDVRRALVEVRAAERHVEIAREALVAGEASLDLMTELHRAGNVTDPRLSAERVASSRARLELAAAEAAVIEAREPLNRLLGLWGDAVSWESSGALDDDVLAGLNLEQVEARAITASLALAENRAHAEARARSAGIARWEVLLPGAELGVGAQREPEGEWGVGPSIGLELPIFDSGTSHRRAALRRLEASLARHVQLGVDVRVAARLLRGRVVTLADRAQYLREQHLPALELLVRHTLRDYNAMQTGVFAVLEVRAMQLAGERDHVETLRDAWIARIDLEELLEGRLDPDLGARRASMEPATARQGAGGH